MLCIENTTQAIETDETISLIPLKIPEITCYVLEFLATLLGSLVRLSFFLARFDGAMDLPFYTDINLGQPLLTMAIQYRNAFLVVCYLIVRQIPQIKKQRAVDILNAVA